MKQQVVFVHGWESKENYRDFNDYLDKFKYESFKIKAKKWKETLKEDLWEDFEVFIPLMPNKDFADYDHWKIMFKKVIPFLKDDVILVGHSLWGTFLTKYLNENNFSLKIKKIFLISWAFKDSENEVLWNFNFDKTLEWFKKYEEKIIFYHSRDDLVVPFSDLEDFKKVLANSEYKIFEYRFHFIDETFPELIVDIKENIKKV